MLTEENKEKLKALALENPLPILRDFYVLFYERHRIMISLATSLVITKHSGVYALSADQGMG